MKKLFTLLWLSITAFTFTATAQTNTCNAEFSTQLLNNYTYKFNPAVVDTPGLHHAWNFGDGTPVVGQVSPTHSFALPGTYAVVHTVYRPGINGTVICTESITHLLVIQQQECNLIVDFSWNVSTANPLMIAFHNLSVPLAATDSVTWIFGDNSSSNDVNPVHTYANAGTYSVCLIVKKITAPGTPACVRYICKTIVVTQTCNLVVDFNWNISTANPLTYEFHNLSVPLAATDSVTWNFGDGTSSHDVNANHTYTNAGTYNVCLIVKKNNNTGTTPCVRYICKTIVVQAPCNLVVNFNSNSSGNNPLIVYFQNLSTPLAASDSISWTFGDGTSSNEVNPVHTYANTGTYNVCLTIRKNNNSGTPCIRYICKTVVVLAPCNLVVDFNWNISTANPLSISFHNLSTPLAASDSITWNFGDGTSSHDVNPVHTYTNSGTYNVCLIVKKNNNTSTPCIRYICKTITVLAPCNLVVDFNWSITASNPLTYYFHNLSIPLAATDSITWTFGDGTSSHDVNPVHTYTSAGSYTVCLIVKKNTLAGTPPCERYICKTVVIQAPCNLVVDFSSNSTTANPLIVEFHNLSIPLEATDSITWSFGDGTSSHDVNPIHTYANAGTYTACLTVKKNNNTGTPPCVRYICKPVTVVTTCNLVAYFTWHADSAIAQKIWFTNLSTPLNTTDSVRWTFGDGTSSNQFNPDHTYAQPGTYTVCLRMQKRGPAGTVTNCISEICKTVVVLPNCNLAANFTWRADSANTLKIWFTNTSVPLNNTDSIRWTFGDGSASNQVNPDHIYSQPGTYTVCLRVQKRNTAGGVYNCVSEICKTLVVQSTCNFQANYSWRLDSLNSRKVYFTNLTMQPNALATATWSFGDGTTATSWNAVHEYAQPGRYYVCLRVQLTPNCVRYKCDSITVPVSLPPCHNQSNFTFLRSGTSVQTFIFTPDFQSPNAVYTWTFGDGSGSNAMVPTHTYTQAGTYTVCLTVSLSLTCASTTCKTLTVNSQVNCDSIHVTYNYQFDAFMPNKVYFYANANFPVLDQTWTITRIPNNGQPVIIHQSNPSYIFNDTGYYNVCLRAITLGGCIKEYCRVIRIQHVAAQCQLQAYPNPATTQVSVNVPLPQAYMINVYVYNSLNIQVLEKHQQGVAGNNLVTLNISTLVAGIYTMKVIYGNQNCTSVFQKL